MRFSGELIAGGIIPDLDVDLRLMDDFSLGIESSSPPEGYPLYRGLGTINADLVLNMSGLQGTGVIDYLSSHITGDKMVLVPDSSFGVTTSYVNEAIFDHISQQLKLRLLNLRFILTWKCSMSGINKRGSNVLAMMQI